MSLWCPYIKANYCFLWSCNKYILRHPVAKGADCFQERTWKHVLLATGKGPRQPRVSPPRHPAANPVTTASTPAGRKRERAGSLPWASASDLVVGRWVPGQKAGLGVEDQKGRPHSRTVPSVRCHSSQRVIDSDGFCSPYSATSWAVGPQTSGGDHSKAPSLSCVSLNVVLSGKLLGSGEKSEGATLKIWCCKKSCSSLGVFQWDVFKKTF